MKEIFEEVQAKFIEYELAATVANAQLRGIRNLRDSLCPHTEMIPKEHYSSGSYYDKAYTEYWSVCACCGYSTPRTTEEHSWYG